ncbi:efflux RND transporter periplasmic adaptor subunit [Sphingomonas bacterium]|uniref:efflux RND transporter periplasmic adaptor subunit n=1 Tax=Sphingomonas bacterium TaxID=1895847 RepID=UPI0015767EB2|nr:efflux RND transporter periplasmic adaptor subunit [Sphingomonas bacterium]
MKVVRPLPLATALLLVACGHQPPPPPPPPGVGYVTVSEQAVTLSSQLPGRTAAFETSDIRPQVNGLIEARLFTEGDAVAKGQPLYRIDAQPYRAQLANARAALARAQAAIASSAALARRYGELVKINAIAKQDYDNALTSAAQARADVAAQQAAVRTAAIDLDRTTIRAPIAGRIGRSTYTTGALVAAAQANPLATIQRLDPIYVDIQQSSADLLKLRQQMLAGELQRDAQANVTLLLENGTTYGATGKLRFADVTVDQTTGSQVIRAIFPNPNGLLLPGMYVRAAMVEGRQARATLVPQRAVSRDERGNAAVMVVGQGNKAEPRTLQTERTVGDNWLVTGGVRPGDRVIVEGGMTLRPGMVVTPSPWTADARSPTAPAPLRRAGK